MTSAHPTGRTERTPDPEWFAYVRVGDVLKVGESYRVVREVTRWAGRLRFVTFAIRRPSWTGRCYTCVSAADLKTRQFRFVGARLKLASEFDAKIAAAIQQPSWERPYVLRAPDVRGIA